MFDFLLSLSQGFVTLPWWGYVLVALAFSHITIVSVTVFLHRHQAHRALELNPLASHFFRFWLVAYHRHGNRRMGRDPSQTPREL
jgi:stearoyl-CoA desaturase (Delta-9 desaturase)